MYIERDTKILQNCCLFPEEFWRALCAFRTDSKCVAAPALQITHSDNAKVSLSIPHHDSSREILGAGFFFLADLILLFNILKAKLLKIQ